MAWKLLGRHSSSNLRELVELLSRGRWCRLMVAETLAVKPEAVRRIAGADR
ncbi:hypothetical protein [Rhizobium leguminosarum]|uniref:hypothetical protein n=1 Tax=Rhizobium leguminosarum TaxID=384 RepID=UPI00031A65BA|nr:hypothetical protein [Rhizobium leguminosarum]